MTTWLTLEEARQQYGLSRATLYRLIRQGRVARASRVGDRRVYISADDLNTLTKVRTGPRRPPAMPPWEFARVAEPDWLQAVEWARQREYRAMKRAHRIWQKGHRYLVNHIDQHAAAEREAKVSADEWIRALDGDRGIILALLREKKARKK